MDEENRFYVYEWFKIETNEVFYVGKGTKNRCKDRVRRNRYFIRIIEKYNCSYRVIQENMNEKDALLLEMELIKRYRELGNSLANITDGGENPPALKGELNGFYNKKHSDESRKKMSDSQTGKWKGEKNNQYGISPKDRMSEEVYNTWKENHSIAFSGKGNNQYGISPKERMDEETYNGWIENHRKIKGKNNPNIKPIFLLDENKKEISKFEYMKQCAEYLIENNYTQAKKPESIMVCIWKAIKEDKKYLKFYFRYADGEND